MQVARNHTSSLVLAAVALAAIALPGAAQTTQRVSYEIGGAERDQPSAHPALNLDGSLVAYDCSAPVGGGGYRYSIMLHHVPSGTTVNPVPFANQGCFWPKFARTGPYMTFQTHSTNLDPDDTVADLDVYLLHLSTGQVEWVSRAWDGSNTLGQAQFAQVSGGGSQVVFESPSNGLTLDPDTNPWTEIFVRDRANDTTVLISKSLTGTTGDGRSVYPVLSNDGRHIAFSSDSTDLVVGDTNGVGDVFVCDRDADGNGIFDDTPNTIVRVSVADDGTQANNYCNMPSISGDGRYVAWDSAATNLIASDHTFSGYRIFVHDRDPDENGVFDEGNGITTLENRNSLGDQATGDSRMARLSQDGRKLAFYAASPNLVQNGSYYNCVYLRDLDAGQTRLVSVDSTGTYPNGSSGLNYWSDGGTAISADGTRVAFCSSATNLDVGDTNGWEDIFVHTPAPDPGRDLGYYVRGSNGDWPVMHLQGPMTAGQACDLWLRFGSTNQIAWLVASDGMAPFPFRDGTIVPDLVGSTIFGPIPTDGDGRIDFTIVAPPVVQPLTVYAQWILWDPGMAQNVGFSNAVELEIGI